VDIKLGAPLMESKLIDTDSTWRRQPGHLQFWMVTVCLGGQALCKIHPNSDVELLDHRSFPIQPDSVFKLIPVKLFRA
jgi:hypothetical protein